MQFLKKYIYDPSPINALSLAIEYEKQDQLASAITYYLFAAESDDTDLQYEGLLRTALCYEKEGGRDGTVIDTLHKAMAIRPEKPEAAAELCRVYNNRKRHHEAYSLASIYLNKGTLKKSLKNCTTEYEPKTSFLFEKAVGAWWIGYTEESRELMYNIYTLDNTRYKNIAFTNLRSIGYPRALNQYTRDMYPIMKQKFDGLDKIDENYAQMYQDMFVITELEGKVGGTYLEIGCAAPIMFNNTYLLEKDFDWKGIGLDIEYHHIALSRLHRKNPCINADALKINYVDLLVDMPKTIDYLQVDCEPADVSFDILKKVINESGKIFNTITFEHDSYLFGNEVRDQCRRFLRSKGYVLTVPDVKFDESATFEDWWTHSSISKGEYSSLEDYFFIA